MTTSAPNTWDYHAYGLTLRSEVALGLNRTAQIGPTPDLSIRKTPLAAPAPDDAVFEDKTWWFHFSEVAQFALPSTGDIQVDPKPGVQDALLHIPLTGLVLAMQLQRRGLFVLHGSVVDLDGQALVILGDRGAGKSTTSAAFVHHGYNLISDDVAAFDVSAAQAQALPGFPQIKLSPEAAAVFPFASQKVEGPQIHPNLTKEIHFLQDAPEQAPRPADHICIVERGAALGLHRLAPPEALSELLRHSFFGRFPSDATPRGLIAAHLQTSAALAARGLVYRLGVPDRLDGLNGIVNAVVRDVTGQGASS